MQNGGIVDQQAMTYIKMRNMEDVAPVPKLDGERHIFAISQYDRFTNGEIARHKWMNDSFSASPSHTVPFRLLRFTTF